MRTLRCSLILLLSTLSIWACDSTDNSRFPVEVTYQITGTPQTATIEYSENDSLIAPRDRITIPWTHSFQASEEQILSLGVIAGECQHRLCDLELSILENGKEIRNLSIDEAMELNPDTMLLDLDSTPFLRIAAWVQADSIPLHYNVFFNDHTGSLTYNTSTGIKTIDVTPANRGTTIRDTVSAGFPAFIEFEIDQVRISRCIGLQIVSSTINFKNQPTLTSGGVTELCVENSGSARIEIDIP